MSFKTALLGAALFAAAAPAAFAADVSAPAPAPASTSNSLSIEFSPEWKTSDSSWADDYVKLGYSHTFSNNFVWGAAFQYTNRGSSDYEQAETSLGYKIKAGAFTLTPGVLLGYGFGDLPKIDPVTPANAEAYYAATLAGDLKLNDQLTWNMFNARYRNAFNVTWITPKVSTGFTYKLDGSSSIYANIGYAWKDTGLGAGLQGDKWNIAVGYKYAF